MLRYLTALGLMLLVLLLAGWQESNVYDREGFEHFVLGDFAYPDYQVIISGRDFYDLGYNYYEPNEFIFSLDEDTRVLLVYDYHDPASVTVFQGSTSAVTYCLEYTIENAEILSADIDNNGLDDLIFISAWGTSGLGAHALSVLVVFLYDNSPPTFAVLETFPVADTLRLFADVNQDGKYEFIYALYGWIGLEDPYYFYVIHAFAFEEGVPANISKTSDRFPVYAIIDYDQGTYTVSSTPSEELSDTVNIKKPRLRLDERQ